MVDIPESGRTAALKALIRYVRENNAVDAHTDSALLRAFADNDDDASEVDEASWRNALAVAGAQNTSDWRTLTTLSERLWAGRVRADVEARGITAKQLVRAARAICRARGKSAWSVSGVLDAITFAVWRRPQIYDAPYVAQDPADAAAMQRFLAGATEQSRRRYQYSNERFVVSETTALLTQPLHSSVLESAWPPLRSALLALQVDWTAVAAHLALVPPRNGPWPLWTTAADGSPWPRADAARFLDSVRRQGVSAYDFYDVLQQEAHPRLADLVVWHVKRHPSAYCPLDVLATAYPLWPEASTMDIATPGGSAPPAKRARSEDSDLSACVIHSLPAELLETIMQWLPLATLVQCRKVCLRWRAVVATLAARDQPFAFRCGAISLMAIQQLPGAESYIKVLMDYDDSETLQNCGMWCTCGRLLPARMTIAMLEVASNLRVSAASPHAGEAGGSPSVLDTLRRLPYEASHDTLLPVARWRHLHSMHMLACELTASLARVDSRVATAHHNGASQWPWVPIAVWLPPNVVRPQSALELLRLVAHLFDRVRGSKAKLEDLFETLSDPGRARAWYDPQALVSQQRFTAEMHGELGGVVDDLPREAWFDTWRGEEPLAPATLAQLRSTLQGGGSYKDMNILARQTPFGHFLSHASDPTGWDRRRYKARSVAVLWKAIVACGYQYDYRHSASFVDQRLAAMSDDAITRELEQMVVAFDAAADLFQARCTLSVCYNDDEGQTDAGAASTEYRTRSLFVGLSPDGHLVGALTRESYNENR